jgi:hypothetical protein
MSHTSVSRPFGACRDVRGGSGYRFADWICYRRDGGCLGFRPVHLGACLQRRGLTKKFAGDEGGIVCHIVPEDGRNAIVVSLTMSECIIPRRLLRPCSIIKSIG